MRRHQRNPFRRRPGSEFDDWHRDPPVGMLIYIVCRIARISILEFARDAFWPTVGLIVVLFLITYIPSLVTWLPNLVLSK